MATKMATMAAAHKGEVAKQQHTKLPKVPKVPLHQAYHRFRTDIESSHRERILRQSGMWYLPPCVSLDSIPKDMGIGNIQSCCNKSAPIYVIQDTDFVWEIWDLLYALLHNYIYRRWFQPYRSEIDNGQFLVQPIAVHSFPVGLTAATSIRLSETAHFAASLGRAICAHVETVQQKIGSRTHGLGLGTYAFKKRELRALLKDIGPSARDSEVIEDQRLLMVQPLFRAVAIVLRGSDFDVFTKDISQIPVLLVLTGIEEGLSAPITFDPIVDQVVVRRDQSTDSVQSAETTLSAAVGFLINLEQREMAAFGSKPGFCNEPTRTLFLCDQTLASYRRRYGWGAADVPKGSSANWVDTDIYQEWTGQGADYGEGTAQDWEERARRFAYAAARGEDLWQTL